MSTVNCPSCGAPIAAGARDCKYCGESIAAEPVAQPTPPPQYAPPQYTQPPPVQPMYAPQPQPIVSPKSRVTAGVLAILLGGLGVHKFYLGKIGMGILYLLFCWTYVPAIVGLIEGIVYLASSDEAFYMKHVRK